MDSRVCGTVENTTRLQAWEFVLWQQFGQLSSAVAGECRSMTPLGDAKQRNIVVASGSAGGDALCEWCGLDSYVLGLRRCGHVEDTADNFEIREAEITNEVYTFRGLTYWKIAG